MLYDLSIKTIACWNIDYQIISLDSGLKPDSGLKSTRVRDIREMVGGPTSGSLYIVYSPSFLFFYFFQLASTFQVTTV